jgi:hypothetical protein
LKKTTVNKPRQSFPNIFEYLLEIFSFKKESKIPPRMKRKTTESTVSKEYVKKSTNDRVKRVSL